jgi:5-methylcytosine-specific restriction endonuclease McrA
MTGKCYVCENTLDYDNMECSHIIAHALGGDISLDNLQPCCKSCNRDMGIMNLYEYKNLIFSIK